MTLMIHPDAARRFDELADQLLGKLSSRPPPPRRSQGDLATRFHIPDHVMVEGALTEESYDLTGDRGFLVTTASTGSIGLYAQDYVELQKLAERLQSTKGLHDTLSVKFVRDQVFSWLKERHAGRSTEPMSSTLLNAAGAAIADHEVLVPIQNLFIQAPFEVGPIQFRTIDKSIFETTEERARNHPTATPDEKATLLTWIDKTKATAGARRGHSTRDSRNRTSDRTRL